MGAIVPRRSICGSGAFLQNRPRSSLDYKIGWFRKWVVLQAGKWGQMRHVWPRTKIPRKKFPAKKNPAEKIPAGKIPAEKNSRGKKFPRKKSDRKKCSSIFRRARKMPRENFPAKKFLPTKSIETKICSNCPRKWKFAAIVRANSNFREISAKKM